MIYMYTAVFTPIEDGSGYYAKIPDLPCCITTGKDLHDAINQITDAMNCYLVVAEDNGLDIAPPTAQSLIQRDNDDICTLIKADTIAYRKSRR